MGIIHTGWQGKAPSRPLHLSTGCQHLLSQGKFTGPAPMRSCSPWCRGKASVTPQGLLPPIFFQDALNSNKLRNDWRRMHVPSICLSFGASIFSSCDMCCQKERAWKSKLSSATDYIASVQTPYPWSTGTWSYATVYYQALLILEITAPGTKVKEELRHPQ